MGNVGALRVIPSFHLGPWTTLHSRQCELDSCTVRNSHVPDHIGSSPFMKRPGAAADHFPSFARMAGLAASGESTINHADLAAVGHLEGTPCALDLGGLFIVIDDF